MLWTSRSKTRKHGIILDQPVDDNSRCRECDGACCRSFASVAVSWTEYERLMSLGATRLHFSLSGHHQLIIENGCEFLVTGRCSIYEQRPDICRRFFCEDR